MKPEIPENSSIEEIEAITGLHYNETEGSWYKFKPQHHTGKEELVLTFDSTEELLAEYNHKNMLNDF